MLSIRLRLRVLFVALLALSVRPAFAVDVITYTVTPDVPAKQLAIVLTVPHVTGTTLQVQIPTWSPGAYILGNYAASILDVSARGADDSALTVAHPDKLTWEIATNGAKEIRVMYRVDHADLVEENGKPKRGHITGPRDYLYVVGRKGEPTRLTLNVPAGWKIANSLDPAPEPVAPPNSFDAPSYDVLADAPTEMGDYAEDNFDVRGTPYKIVLYGNYAHVDRAKLREYCDRIADAEISFFGDIPYHRYVFFFRVNGPTGRGAGGLEHLGSTEINFSGPVNDTTRSVIAHEHFHLWNVKRIRPFVLGPFDYTGPNRTANLWWSEGITSYYGDLLSRRAGINTEDEYLRHLADTIGQLQNNPARLKITADESSLKVWDAGNSRGFGSLSYYTKGELIGLCLDLKIRQMTQNLHNLDDVMRYLYYFCGRGNGPGFGEDDIKKAVNRVSEHDLSDFYDMLARSTQEMPFNECLGYVGLKLSISDKPVITPDLGFFTTFDAEAKATRVRNVTADGPAAKAGLQTDDLLVAIDGKPLPQPTSGGGRFTPPQLTALKAGAHVKLTIERGGKRQEIDYVVGSTSRKPWIIERDPAATESQKALCESWLSGN